MQTKQNQNNKLISVKQVYLVLNIRSMSTGSIDRCVANMDPVSGREAGRRNEDLEHYCSICFYNLLQYMNEMPLRM